MAWAWLNHKREDSAEWTGFLDQGVKIEGRLEAVGTFRIDSLMKGKLASDGTLIIGEHALIEGQVAGNNVLIAGRVDGIVHARTKVEIQANAIVTGEIHCPCLVIEPGAAFTGEFYLPPSHDGENSLLIPIRSIRESAHKSAEASVA